MSLNGLLNAERSEAFKFNYILLNTERSPIKSISNFASLSYLLEESGVSFQNVTSNFASLSYLL